MYINISNFSVFLVYHNSLNPVPLFTPTLHITSCPPSSSVVAGVVVAVTCLPVNCRVRTGADARPPCLWRTGAGGCGRDI